MLNTDILSKYIHIFQLTLPVKLVLIDSLSQYIQIYIYYTKDQEKNIS